MARVVRNTALVLVLGCLAASLWLGSYVVRAAPRNTESTAIVYIPRGTPIRDISTLLAGAGLIRDDIRFILLVKVMGLATRLPAGEFRLHTNQRPMDLVRELVSARPLDHLLTIPEGLRITEIATLLAAQGWAERERFVARTRDKTLIAELGLEGVDSLEGYLYPDTYRLNRPAPGEDALIRMLVERAFAVWEELPGGTAALSRHEVFTLASMIEKETGQVDERPLIAAVFLNRLKKNMRLQSDPTVIYGINDFSGTLTRSDLRSPTPYNTYTIPALPPGPICSPGKAALKAVLSPADTDALYFVSKNDGTHHFSKTLREHNRAVRIYRRSPDGEEPVRKQ